MNTSTRVWDVPQILLWKIDHMMNNVICFAIFRILDYHVLVVFYHFGVLCALLLPIPQELNRGFILFQVLVLMRFVKIFNWFFVG